MLKKDFSKCDYCLACAECEGDEDCLVATCPNGALEKIPDENVERETIAAFRAPDESRCFGTDAQRPALSH